MSGNESTSESASPKLKVKQKQAKESEERVKKQNTGFLTPRI